MTLSLTSATHHAKMLLVRFQRPDGGWGSPGGRLRWRQGSASRYERRADCVVMGWVRRSLTMDECPSLAIPSLCRCSIESRRGKGRSEMRKLHLLGVVLIAVVAFGVVSAATASAVTFLLAEWLVGGAAVTSTVLTETTGELLISENMTVLGVKVKIGVLCSGIFVGNIGSDGADDITELLNLPKELIDLTPLVELGLECTNDENCPEPLAWADNLPWLTQLELMVDGSEEFFVDLLTPNGNGNPGYHVVCMGDTALMTYVNQQNLSPR